MSGLLQVDAVLLVGRLGLGDEEGLDDDAAQREARALAAERDLAPGVASGVAAAVAAGALCLNSAARPGSSRSCVPKRSQPP